MLSAFDWLNSQFSLFGLPVYWSDFIGNILALATVVFALKRSVWSWPVQILGSVFLLIASLNVHLVGNAGRQVIIIVTAAWGWAMWNRTKHRTGALPVRWASWWVRAWLVVAMVGGTLAIGALLHATNQSYYPGAPWWLVLCDAWIFVGTVVAMFAQGRRWVEFWFVWIAVDVVGVPLAVHSGLYFSGIVYAVFFVLVLIGIRDWARRSRAEPVRPPSPDAAVTAQR